MNQTPAHEHHNPDLLNFIPTTCMSIVDVGCSSGALARELKKRTPQPHVIGLEIDPSYAELARRHCDESLTIDIESASEEFWYGLGSRDCFVFGDTLEHFKDPWAILRKVGQYLKPEGLVVACIPNAQHWSIQAKLCIGEFRYQDMGLLDRTHLRWFTRKTIHELFYSSGFLVEASKARVFNEPNRAKYLPVIRNFAETIGSNPDEAERDATPLQYVVRSRLRHDN